MMMESEVSLGFSRAEMDAMVGRSSVPTLMVLAVGLTGVTASLRVTYHLKTIRYKS